MGSMNGGFERAIAIAVVAMAGVAAPAGAGGMHMGNMPGMMHGGAMGNAAPAGAGAHWAAPEAAAERVNPVAASPESVRRGADLFAGNCASCHGRDARGDGLAAMALNPKPANLRRMAGMHPDGDFAWKIANGRGQMPAWKGTLSEHQIWDLTNYIQSLALPVAEAQADGVPHGHDGGD